MDPCPVRAGRPPARDRHLNWPSRSARPPGHRGIDAILLPGDPERHTLEERTAHGIPLDDPHWARLVDLADRLQARIPD